MIEYQFYWPKWWKLWPSYKSWVDIEIDYTRHQWTFCFGPLQLRKIWFETAIERLEKGKR